MLYLLQKSPYYPSRVLLEQQLLILLLVLRILISFLTGLNVNLSQFLLAVVTASTLGWFLHFIMLSIASLLSDNGSAFYDTSKFRLVTTLEKKSFRVFATFCSSIMSSSSSIRVIFWRDSLIGKKWLNCFPKGFIVCSLFTFNDKKHSYLAFHLSDRHLFLCLWSKGA